MTTEPASRHQRRTGITPAYPKVLHSDAGLSFSFSLNTDNRVLEIAYLDSEQPDLFGGRVLSIDLMAAPSNVALAALRFAGAQGIDRAQMIAAVRDLMIEGVVPSAQARFVNTKSLMHADDASFVGAYDNVLRSAQITGSKAVGLFDYMMNLANRLEADRDGAMRAIDYALENNDPEFMSQTLGLSGASVGSAFSR